MKKYVWYDKRTGKFSNSWDKDDFGVDMEMIIEDGKNQNDMVMISYEVETGQDFEFTHLMRIA